MTKTLTEQWREGELQFGVYYVKFPNEKPAWCGMGYSYCNNSACS